VVDAEGQLLGTVSRGDILRAEQESRDTEETRQVSAWPRARDVALEAGMHVEETVPATALDVMSLGPLALNERSNIGQAASLMAFEGVHHVAVVADRGDVVGIVSALDILRWFGQHSGYLIPAPRGLE
jgi:CBS domain-containing protein